MCTILQRKAITDRQAAYIINSVLLPQILYRVTLTILPKSTINNITGKYTKLCKKKSQMPATTPNSVMHHRNMFGVKKLADVQSEEQISTLMLHLNNQGIVGETTCTCLLQLQIREAMAEVPTMVPTDVIPYHHCLISQVCQLMHDHGVTLDINMAPMLSLPRNAISILKPTYTGNFLEWWMEQKSEELEHVSDEELDHLITNQPQPIALPSPPLLAPLNGTELEDNSDLEAHITSEERDVDMDNKTQADLAPQNRPMPLPVQQKQQHKAEIMLFSDRSVLEAGTEKSSMAFGVVIDIGNNKFAPLIGGGVAGFTSSTKAELVGLLTAVLSSPRKATVKIYIDNMAVVQNFQKLVQDWHTATVQAKLWTTYAKWWDLVAVAVKNQGGKVTVEWIKGHAGHAGNEAADRAAKAVHGGHLWDLAQGGQGEIQCQGFVWQVHMEDDVHQTTMESQQEAWWKCAEKVNKDGRRAYQEGLRQWKKAEKDAEERGQVASFKAKQPKFTSRKEEDILESLSGWIFGVKEMLDPEETEDLEDLDVWKVMDLYIGLVPRKLGEIWKHTFGTSKTIARYMAGKFVKALEEYGRTELWGARCKTTVEWEKSVGITAVSKRAQGRTGVGGHLGSGSDFSDLTSRPRSGTDTLELTLHADTRVLKQYQGLLRLDVME
ncbi:hypothetical protein CPB97_007010, partial [Podila verticillata]